MGSPIMNPRLAYARLSWLTNPLMISWKAIFLITRPHSFNMLSLNKNICISTQCHFLASSSRVSQWNFTYKFLCWFQNYEFAYIFYVQVLVDQLQSGLRIRATLMTSSNNDLTPTSLWLNLQPNLIWSISWKLNLQVIKCSQSFHLQLAWMAQILGLLASVLHTH